MKKVLISGMIAVLGVSTCISPSFASNLTLNDTVNLSQPYSSRMTYIANAKSGLSINASGSANITSSITGNSGVTKTEITSYLKQYKDGKWIIVETWSSSSSRTCSLSKFKTVPKGYTYKVSSIVKAYKGNSSENRTVESNSAKY